jgi:hypothetical protein
LDVEAEMAKERRTGGKERLEEEQRRGEQRTRSFGNSFVALFGK